MPRPAQTVTKPRTLPRGFTWDAARRRVVHQWADETGRMRKVRGVSVDACREARAAVESSTAAPAPTSAAPSAVTWTEMFDRWFRTVAGGKSATTLDGFRWARDVLASTLDGKLAREPIGTITTGDVESAFLELIDRGVAGSFGKLRSLLGRVFRYACRHGVIAESPMDAVEMPETGPVGRDSRWLDADEFVRLRGYLMGERSTVEVLALAGLMTGMRPGELLGLRWDAVDYDAGVIHVRSALHARAGKRSWEVTDALKNEHSRRTLDMPDVLAAALREHHARQTARDLASGNRCPDGLVFTSRNATHIRPQHLARDIAAVCRSAGVTEISPNGLRHSVATFMLVRGRPVTEVARQLGHADIHEVIRTYGHLAKPDVVPSRGVLAS